MKENYLMEDIIEKYGKVEFKKTNFHGNNSSKFLSDLLKGIECNKCFFRTNDGLPLNSTQVEKSYEPFIENGEQLVCLDQDNITIRSKDKRLTISTKDYSRACYNDVMTMHHSTKEGLYYFKLQAVTDVKGQVARYEFNLLHYPILKGEDQMNVGVHQPVCFHVPEYTVAQYKPIEIVEEDIPKLTNKLFRDGLPALSEKVRKEEKIELQEFKEPENKADNEQLNIKNVIDVLMYLNDKGIELSDEQKNMIYLYKNIDSDKHIEEVHNHEEENSRTK